MTRTKYSHMMNKRQIVMREEREKWFVGVDWIMLFIAAAFSGLIVTTMYKHTEPELVDIAVYQLILGMVGLMMGTTINIRRSGVLPGMRVGMPTQKDGETIFVYVTAGFIGLQLFNTMISSVRFSTIGDILPDISMDAYTNIAFTAAVMEEALYSYAFTGFFFAVFLYMFIKVLARYDESVELMAMIPASILVGVLFVLIHVGVYGFQPQIVIQLFVNRFVYSVLYIKTRNLSVPTLLHLAHNAMVLLPF